MFFKTNQCLLNSASALQSKSWIRMPSKGGVMRHHNQWNENNRDPENIDFNDRDRSPRRNYDHYNNQYSSHSPRSVSNHREDRSERSLTGDRYEPRREHRGSSNYSQGGHGPRGSSRYEEDRQFRNNRDGDNNDNRDYRLNRDYNRGHSSGQDEYYERPDSYRDNSQSYSENQGQWQNTYEGERFHDRSMQPSYNRVDQRGYQYGSDDYRPERYDQPERPPQSRRRHYNDY